MSTRTVAILGAGPAGLGAARQLMRAGKAKAVVLERQADVGGNAGSFEIDGIPVDFGSHRLHPACDPAILDDLRQLLGDDLLDRPRHGRIRLRNRWIHFPLKPVDLVRRLPPSFAFGVAKDAVVKAMKRGSGADSGSYGAVLERGLGRTICRDFYFPYARKIWGLDPSALSPIQATRRVSASSLWRLVGKVLQALPGFASPGAGRFYYPKKGYGQICQRLATDARERGADLRLNAKVTGIETGTPHRVIFEQDGVSHELAADHVWSTIPITVLARLIRPAVPDEVLNAASSIQFRAMILVYLLLEQDRFSEYDAHYFPDDSNPITRLSEPQNYSNSQFRRNRTVLCAELPCSTSDANWVATDSELADLVRRSLDASGLPVRARILQTCTRRLPNAYPLYVKGYEVHFDTVDQGLSGLANILTFGRQGLFAHDNTHHALAMAYAAVACLRSDGTFDESQWKQYRVRFESHVVED